MNEIDFICLPNKDDLVIAAQLSQIKSGVVILLYDLVKIIISTHYIEQQRS